MSFYTFAQQEPIYNKQENHDLHQVMTKPIFQLGLVQTIDLPKAYFIIKSQQSESSLRTKRYNKEPELCNSN